MFCYRNGLFINILTFEWITLIENTNCTINWWNISIFVIPNNTLVQRRILYFETSFPYIISWWHLRCKDGWTPLSATKLGWFLNMRLLQKDKFGRIWVGSEIIRFTSLEVVNESTWLPSDVEGSVFHHSVVLTWKILTIRSRFHLKVDHALQSSFTANNQSSSKPWDWSLDNI